MRKEDRLMGSTERKLKMITYLCRKRHTTLTELSEYFGVSIRTIQRDILELETLGIPLDVKMGRYEGGVYVVGNYTIDRMYMNQEEIFVLQKVQQANSRQEPIHLSEKESQVLNQIIQNYSKPSVKNL